MLRGTKRASGAGLLWLIGQGSIAVIGITRTSGASAGSRSLTLLQAGIAAASHSGSVGAAILARVRGGRCHRDNNERG
jgi:hypothetical protein